jgi:hypothetical protein
MFGAHNRAGVRPIMIISAEELRAILPDFWRKKRLSSLYDVTVGVDAIADLAKISFEVSRRGLE